MKQVNPVFIANEGEYGITRTQAQHLSAVAAHFKTQSEKRLERTSFLNCTISLIGSTVENTSRVGMTDLDILKKDIKTISDMNAFIAWFREADKNLNSVQQSYQQADLDDYLQEMQISLEKIPMSPEMPQNVTLDDALDALDVKNLELYRALEAKSAVYGKYIHPSEALEQARSEVYDRLQNKIEVTGDGRDTVLQKYEPSVPVESIDTLYNELQYEYRKVEQQLNHMKSDLRNWVDTENRKRRDAYNIALQKHCDLMSKITDERSRLSADMQVWRDENLSKLAKMRIRVPEALKETEKMLRELGK